MTTPAHPGRMLFVNIPVADIDPAAGEEGPKAFIDSEAPSTTSGTKTSRA